MPADPSLRSRISGSQPRPSSRRGIQLLELVITLTTSSILIAGVSTSLYLASEGREIATTTRNQSQASATGLERLQHDLSEAKTITSLTATDVTMTVQDRDGDNADETLQYEWASTGTPLRYHDGSDWRSITGDLQNFSLIQRLTPPNSEGALSFDPPGQFLFMSHTRDDAGTGGWFNSDSGTDITVDIPPTFQAGDLLIAAVSVEGDQGNSIVSSGSWVKLLEVNNTSGISLAVFYSTNPSGNQVDFSWANSETSHAAIAHFRNPGSTIIYGGAVTNQGTSQNPSCPSTTTTRPNSLVLRVLATDQTDTPEDATNMPLHFAVLHRTRLLTGPSVAIAYQNLGSSGTVPAATFGLTKSRDFATATLVFAQ
ncbi:MAG: hypothetical protein ACE361_18255 [Aureliella sp.]